MNIIVLLFYNSKLAESVESGLVSLFHNLGRSGPGSAQVHFLLVYIFVILKNLLVSFSLSFPLCASFCVLLSVSCSARWGSCRRKGSFLVQSLLTLV